MPRSAPQNPRGVLAPSAARLTPKERKRQLLSHAVQVFADRGVHGTTLELVAEAAGVPEATVAKHFPEPLHLFAAALVEVRAATVERWQMETAALPDSLAKLQAIAEMILSDAHADAPEIRLLNRALAECDSTELASLLRIYFVECESYLAGILAEGQQSGVFRRSLDPRVAAWQLLHAGLGHAATRPLRLATLDDGDCLTRAIECLLHGLLKTDV